MDTISSSANRPQRKAIELENAIPFGTKDYVLMGKDVNSLTTKFNPPQECILRSLSKSSTKTIFHKKVIQRF